MQTIHTGSDGQIFQLWGQGDRATLALSESDMGLRNVRRLSDGLQHIGAVAANDQADLTLPGDGWEERGGPRLGDEPRHFVRN